MTELILPERLEIIFDHAFEGCTGLSEIVIPNSVINIFSGAFKNCTGVSTITLGSNVETIWDGTFLNVPVTDVYALSNAPTLVLGDESIFSIRGSTVLHIPAGTLEGYIKAGWERIGFTNIVEM